MNEIPIYKVGLPGYSVETEPDDKVLGTLLDNELKKHFLGHSLVIRGIASSEHPGKSVDELVEIIKKSGSDRYDAERIGDRYENVDGKHIDFFGFPVLVEPEAVIFRHLIWGFYHSAKAVHGKPVRIDIVLVYDATKLEQVVHQYEGQDEIKDDGFAFKNPNNKPAALLALFKLD